jgi:hypothetical protein
MERSFARGTWYGFDRARWRRLWRVEIQEYLIAAIQNIEVLLRYGERPEKSLTVRINQLEGAIKRMVPSIWGMIKDLIVIETNRIMPLDFARVPFNEV